jgi:hypothetical protein
MSNQQISSCARVTCNLLKLQIQTYQVAYTTCLIHTCNLLNIDAHSTHFTHNCKLIYPYTLSCVVCVLCVLCVCVLCCARCVCVLCVCCVLCVLCAKLTKRTMPHPSPASKESQVRSSLWHVEETANHQLPSTITSVNLCECVSCELCAHLYL